MDHCRNHNRKATYGSWAVADAVRRRAEERAERLGKTRGEGGRLGVRRCQGCHRWFVYKERERRWRRPYCRAEEKRWASQFIGWSVAQFMAFNDQQSA